MKSDYEPSKTTIKDGEIIELTTRFGGLSRGRAWGKYYRDKTRPIGDFEWVEKNGGTLYLQGPGYYITDGFNRKAQAQFHLSRENAA